MEKPKKTLQEQVEKLRTKTTCRYQELGSMISTIGIVGLIWLVILSFRSCDDAIDGRTVLTNNEIISSMQTELYSLKQLIRMNRAELDMLKAERLPVASVVGIWEEENEVFKQIEEAKETVERKTEKAKADLEYEKIQAQIRALKNINKE